MMLHQSNVIVWVACLLVFVDVTLLAKTAKSADLEVVAREELRALSRITQVQTRLTITDVGATYSDRDEIVLSRQQFRPVAQKSNITDAAGLLRLVLAHETGHQSQFRSYSVQSMSALAGTDEERRLYECQADMLAGYYLVRLPSGRRQNQGAVDDVLEAAFDLGIDDFRPAATHPSHEARRTAVRRGMGRGLIDNFKEDLAKVPQLAEPIRILQEKLDVRDTENLMAWSLRQSKRIVHSTRRAATDIVFSEEKIEWNTDIKTPVVKYTFAYTNTGTQPIRVDLEARVDLVKRKDANNTLRSYLWSSQNYFGVLRPKETKTVRGILRWADANIARPEFNLKELMPRLVLPARETALWAFEYAQSPPNASPDRELAIGRVETLFDFTKLADTVKMLVEQGNLAALKAGPGLRDGAGIVAYPCTIRLPAFTYSEVVIDPEDRFVHLSSAAVLGGDRESAIREYTEALNSVRSALANWNVREAPPRKGAHADNRTYYFSDSHSGTRVHVSLAYYKWRDLPYTLRVAIYPSTQE